MSNFKKIGLFVKYDDESVHNTLLNLINYLNKKKLIVSVEEKSASLIKDIKVTTLEREKLVTSSDLIIVIGGDGSLLNIAKTVAKHDTPILGINRGRLGFLVDIHPDEFEQHLEQILQGNYLSEKRYLLGVNIGDKNLTPALNDVVLYNSDTSRMIDFEVFLNDKFVMKQRADGLIVSTPTGSTAYALSGGGPILMPQVDSMLLLPMFSHILSSRPIVVSQYDRVDIMISDNNRCTPKISCDGQVHLPVKVGEKISISSWDKEINIIHPENYDYFNILREKLNWIP